MQLDSARELKALLTETVLAPLTAEGGLVKTLALPAEPLTQAAGPVRTLALGIASPRPNEFRLAVRYQRRELAECQADAGAANKLLSYGAAKRNEALDANDLAAWTMVANMILNLDETVTNE